MAIKLKKSYRFALRCSLYISILLTIALVGVLWLTNAIDWRQVLLFSPISFLIPFVLIQTGVEQFIYRRVKKIYDDVSLLESSSFSSKPVTTDMKTLTEEIGKFAQDKKIEIDTLKIREEY